MKKLYLLLLVLFLASKSFSNGGYITISSVVPSSITICGQSKVFSFTINNPSAFNLTGVTVSLTMPTGLNYQLGSVVNATQLSTIPLNAPTFSLANIPSLSSIVVTYTASADCNILTYLGLGQPTENKIQVNYTAGGNTTFDLHTTQVYFVKQPNVSITNITNQSYSGSIGGTFSRCITITNGGTGELSTFTLTDVHGNGIQITAATPGTWTSGGGTETYLFSANDFTAIGNGNTLFETGESLTLCETVKILNCSSVFSSFTAGWGCNAQACQTSVSSANVVFPNFVPNLVVTPQPYVNPCLGSGNFSQQTLKIVNTGAGQAINTLLNIYQTSGPSYIDVSQQTEIDITSITIKVNGGPANPISVTTSTASNAYSCLSASPKAGVGLTIPTINAGDTVRISWKTQSCCSVGGYGYYNGWAYNASYQSICLNNYVVPAAWGQVYTQNYIFGLVNNGSPSTLIGGQTATFSYLLNSSYQSSPALPDAYFKVTFTVSPCYTYSNNTIKMVNGVGTATWLPSSVTQVGNVITAIFSGSAPFNATMYNSLEQAQILIDLTGNCTACTSGPGSIGVGIFYSPSASCGCEVPLNSNSFNLNLVCPITCEGLNFLNYAIKRTSYGLPDNNDDGLPDGVGTVNFAKIKRTRAMYGDTITSSFYAKVKTSVAHPTWQYCYASSTILNGNNLSSIGGKLRIYRAGLLFGTCNISSVTAVAPVATFKYDLSSAALITSGGVAPGFVYIDNDSLVFEPQYKVTTNIGGAIIPASTTNTFITADVPNPVSAVNKFSCNTFQGNFSIIGYYFTNYGPDSYAASNCNQVVITQNYYLSIGPCCGNYTGGNLFPFEYRNWARIDTLTTIVPLGYKFVAAKFYDVRTAGTFGGSSSAVFPITPISAATNTMQFSVGSYFTSASTPSITPSDDGFYGVFTATFEPSCQVAQNVQQNIGYNWAFKPTAYLPQTNPPNQSNTYGQDVITYNGPSIFLQSTLPNVNATSNVVVWDISLSNTTNSPANSTWFTVPTISGITINTVVDLGTSATLTPVGGFYQIGTLAGGGTVKNYRLYGSYTSCTQDSIVVQAGWNCQGYPATLASYPCVTKKLTLKSTPQSPLLITNVITPPTIVNLCDTASYEVVGTNVQLGSVYNLTVSVNIPPGVAIVPGSSQMAYPSASPYVTVSNPVYVGGTIYQYYISVLSPSIGANGMPGILSPGNNSVKIKFKVVTTCGYTSGSLASFSFYGVSGCGASTGQLVSLSSQLGIAGASAPYTTNTVLKSSFISPCNNSSVLKVYSQNLGSLSFGNTDTIRVTMPVGVSYVPGSFVGLTNSPVNPVPVISILNNQQQLAWKLLPGVVPNDSTVFNISYTGNPNLLSCNISNFEAKTTTSSALLCTLTNSFCGVQVITGGDTLPIFTYKSYLSLSNASGYSIPNPPSGETAFVSFTINNTGQTLNSTNNTVISYYNDVNSNGIYNSGDILITQHTVNVAIPSNGSYAYSYTLNIPSGAACHYIAVLDTAFNHCSCTASQLILNLPLRNIAIDTTLCHGFTASLGYNAITGYTYSWTPGTNLNSTSSSNPIVTSVNNSASPITTNYIVTVNRNTCLATDTAKVIMRPVPNLTLSALSSSICVGNSTSIAVSGANSYSWIPTTSLNSNTLSTVIASPSVTINYTVNGTNAFGCSTSSVSSVIVNPLPPVASTSNSLCAGQSATIGASGAVNYTWTPSSSLSSSTASNVSANPAATTIYTVTGTDANGCSKMSTSTVVVNALPVLNTTSGVICTGSSTNINVSGASTYSWSPAAGLSSTTAASVVANPTITTTYTVIGTDAIGCQSQSTSTVVVNALPNLSTTSSTICSGNSGTLTVNGANTYSWVPPLSLNSTTLASVIANPTTSITYTVTGTDLNGCYSTSVSSVMVNSLPPMAATSDTMCAGQTASISANGALSYSWSPASSLSSGTSASVTATPAATTIYSVTGTDANGCSKTVTTTVLVNPLPVLALSNNTLCYGFSGPLTANGAASYTWSPAGTLNSSNASTVTASPTITTVYSVTGQSTQGCIQTATTGVIVNPLPVLSTTDGTICIGSSTVISVSGANSYSWIPGTGLSSATNPNVTANPNTSTTYTVTGIDMNGCSSTSVSSVLVNPLPVVSINSPSVICAGQTASISASGAVTYTWNNSTNSPGQSVSPTVPTSYTVTGEDANGCKKSVVQFLNVLIQPTLSIAGTPTMCVGDQLTLSASGGTTYTWDTGDTTRVITINPGTSSIYTLSSGVSPCNSSTVFAVTVFTPAPISSYAQPATIIYGASSTLFANGTTGNVYSWTASPEITCTSCNNNVVSPEATTVYTVNITDNNGCKITNTVQVEVEIICGNVFVPSGFSPNNDGLNDTWCVYGNCVKTFNLQVFNRWGEKVFESEEKSHCWDGTFGGILQADAVFMYQFTATLINGEKVVKKGNVTLVR
ncbi:MAG: gliding motility-associated C-terminal domain-containing protein [Bacteroidetes bacterium]|nr:gliding motility-associated C-terminal domain-containing protein [Bacteroidota bacterium]